MFSEFKFFVYYIYYITIPKYFIVDTCKGLLIKYTFISLFYFLFLLNIIINLELYSWKLILLFQDRLTILPISMFEMLSTALTVSFLIANMKSLANAIVEKFS